MKLLIIAFLIIGFTVVFFFHSKQPLGDKPVDLGQENLVQNQEDVSQEQPAETEKKPSNQKQPAETEKKPSSQSTEAATVTEPEEPPVDTYITAGPEEGKIIEETNQVTFEFEAQVPPEETKEEIVFETKIEGFDNDWETTHSKKRVVESLSGPKEYTFLVRAKVKDLIDQTPAKRTFKINTSPYFGKVKISNVQAQTSSQPYLITLNTYLKKEEEINITGWQIKGASGSAIIPPGTEIYYLDYNSEPKENIFIKEGDKVYISGGPSPFGGNKSFRSNKCLGYFSGYVDFYVSVSKNCPKPTKEEISFLSPCCKEFILNMRTCEIPDYSKNYKIVTDEECTSYLINNFNYDGCFRNYFKDKDFLGKDWYIYLNRSIVVSDNCDTLFLRDQNGLFIDKYSYGQAVCR